MSSQRYERVRRNRHATTGIENDRGDVTWNTDNSQVSNNDDTDSPISPTLHTPTSPPPSFRSRTSSPSSRHAAVDQTLADTFDADGSDSDEENDGDDRQRLMRGSPSTDTELQATTAPITSDGTRRPPPPVQRTVTQLPVFTPAEPGRIYGGGSQSDGVFANLSAKPELGEKVEEHPPVCIHSIHLIATSLLTANRRTSKQPQMPLLLTGKPQSWHLVLEIPTKFTSKVSPSGPYSALSGTA